jgi:hypothetical protein
MKDHSVSCHICGATFPDSGSMLSHMILVHKI